MRVWQIRGYEGSEKIFETEVRISCFTESQIKNLLKALVAKAGLEFDEIVGAYAKRKMKEPNDLLEINKESSLPVFSCGTNPHFIAKPIGK